MATFAKQAKDGIPDGSFTCCMWCSRIWQLSGTLENVQLSPVSPEVTEKMPELLGAAARFTNHRAWAKRLEIPYVEFVEIIHELFGPKTPRGPFN